MNIYFPNASPFASLIHFSCDKINIMFLASRKALLKVLPTREMQSYDFWPDGTGAIGFSGAPCPQVEINRE